MPYPFIRLLRLAGIPLLLEALTPHQAAAIFRTHGATDDDLATPAALKAARNRIIRTLHSDHSGGDDEDAKHLNAAYDVLKSRKSPRDFAASPKDAGRRAGTAYSSGGNTSYGPSDDEGEDGATPAWQTDGSSYSRVNRQDYSDVNFFKKRMWELSGHSRQTFAVTAFDGHFFRSSTTVYGSPDVFPEMGHAMATWNSKSGNPYRTRAVFAQQGRQPDLLLIWLDGRPVDPPVPMEHDSFNMNPANDQHFVRRLPEMLDKIAAERG